MNSNDNIKLKEVTSSDTSRTQIDQSSLDHSAKQRLKWMGHYKKFRNARLTCRHFGISPDTFYLWKKRFIPNNPLSLADNSKNRKPHRIRQSKHELAHSKTIKTLKTLDPRLGKTRIAKILKETGVKISSSTVGRILKNRKK